MFFGRVTVSVVIGVGLDDASIRKLILNQVSDPGARDDVGSMLLAGVELDSDFFRGDCVESSHRFFLILLRKGLW